LNLLQYRSKILAAYDTAAGDFRVPANAQAPPHELYALVKRFLIPRSVADIGCGSGRKVVRLA
jgi:trans-aconitate methyltransferase